jgi:alginate O-acetyltransferase complex protein AlgI
MIGWVFFRAATLAAASAFLKAMAGLGPAAPTPYAVRWYLTSELWLALGAGVLGSTPWVPALAARLAVARRPAVAWSASLVATATLVALLVASIMQVAAGTYNPFIYFQF